MSRDFSKPFYNSKEWQNVREGVLMRDKYLCVKCGAPAEEVHHKIHLSPDNINDPNITMNPSNLVSLCKDCHMKIHREEKVRRAIQRNKMRVRHRITDERGIFIDEDGQLKQRQVVIVYGAPRSGKTTYVLEHKDEHDIVIDLDAIITALGLSDKRYKDNNIMYLALDVRDFLYEKLANKDSNFDCKTVWIIGGLPKKKEREELAERLNAQLVYIPCTESEAERRSREDNLYGDEIYAEDLVTFYFNQLEK